MRKLIFLLSISMIALLCSCVNNQNAKKPANKRPNILILLADDLGYGELGSYGQQQIKTPTLDSLALKGMRFTDFYAGNAVCSPSRAVLMTGKSSSFNTVRGNSGFYGDDTWMRVALKKSETTMGEMLKTAGYQTGFVGKWHLGDPNDLSTWAYNRGFDYAVQEQWTSRFGGIQYDEQMHWINGKQDSIYYRVEDWDCKDEFRTNLAFDFLDELDEKKPFFLFMSYRAPHGHETTIGNNELYQDQNWPEQERIHASKITLLDQQIGRMITKLKAIGELDNTLILFTSDNGPHVEKGHDAEFFDSNGNLKGVKRDVYEGGIRVPMIAYWKGQIEAGSVSNHLSGFHDLMPTFAALANETSPEESNGISMLPTFLGQEQSQHDFLNWEYQLDGWFRKMPKGGFKQSARIGKWKGVRIGVDSEIELYNLELDIQEGNNVAIDHPDVVKKIESLFQNRVDTEYFPEGGVIQNYKARNKHNSNNQ
ncbi:MAG: sulfatase-like hydrolase/transferase [Reichenbachiella sp.]